MHISSVHILQTVTDRATLQLPTHIKSYVAFQVAYLHLTFAHSIGQGHGHAHFDCEYLTNYSR